MNFSIYVEETDKIQYSFMIRKKLQETRSKLKIIKATYESLQRAS